MQHLATDEYTMYTIPFDLLQGVHCTVYGSTLGVRTLQLLLQYCQSKIYVQFLSVKKIKLLTVQALELDGSSIPLAAALKTATKNSSGELSSVELEMFGDRRKHQAN